MDEINKQNQTALRRPVRPVVVAEGRPERISKNLALLFIFVAFGIDCFEMILEWLGIGIFGLSTIISVCTTLAFWIWFKMHSVRFTGKPKNVTRFGVTAFLEMIPGLDAVFGFVWTVGIFALVASTMEEDGQSNIVVSVYKMTLKQIGL